MAVEEVDVEHPSRLHAVAWGAIVVTATIVPLLVDPTGYDTFRYPKTLGFRAGTLVSAALLLVTALWSRVEWRLPRPIVLWMGAVLGWTFLTTLTSTNRLLSWPSLAWTAMALAFFGCTAILGRHAPVSAIVPPLVGALVNMVVLVLQWTKVWQPVPMPANLPEALHRAALIGNPNEVGTYFFFFAVLCGALTIAARRWRATWGVLTALFLAAIVLSHCVTAAIAVLSALTVIVWFLNRRLVTVVLAIVIPIALIGSVVRIRAAAEEHSWGLAAEAVLSGRVTPFLTALEMAKRRPLVGVGPGTFGWHYLPYQIYVHDKYAGIIAQNHLNFGEVHNDHLEVLAETGLPGVALFMMGLLLLGRLSFRSGDDERGRIVRHLALPLAVGFAALALAQFPLQIASATVPLLFLAGLCVAWSEGT